MDNTTAQTVLGRYRLLRKLGQGGMGEVWLADDPLLHRQVAIKTLPRHEQGDDEYLRRFEREARAAAALHHPHILPVHDYGKQVLPDGKTVTYIVMSYVSGGSVNDRLTRYKHAQALMPGAEAFSYLTQVAEAIDFAHTRGIVHRDIKPANMLLREDNWLLLADFGLARILAESDRLTQSSGFGFGTPKYMAPEQAQGHAVAASDIYSLAVVAYEFFAGRAPFSADTPYATTIQHIMMPPPSPRQFNAALSPAFEAALLRGLAKKPEQRPPSAAALVYALQQAMSPTSSPSHSLYPSSPAVHSNPVTNPPLNGQVTPTLPASTRSAILSRRNLLIGGGATCLLIAGGGVAYALSRPSPQPQQDHHSTPTAGPDPAAPTLAIQSVFTQSVSQLTWSPTSNTLAATDVGSNTDTRVVLWNIVNGQTQAPQPAAQNTFSFTWSGTSDVSYLSWSPDGTSLALGPVSNRDAGDPIQVYKTDLKTLAAGFTNNPVTTNGLVQGMCWAPGPFLCVVDENTNDTGYGFLHIYDSKQPQQKVQANKFSTSSLIGNRLAASPTGSLLAVGNAGTFTNHGVLVGPITVSGTQPAWQPRPLLETDHDIVALAWSPDSRYLAALTSTDSARGAIMIWDATKAYQLHNQVLDLSTIQKKLSMLAWSPTTKNPLFAVATSDGQILLWNITTSPKPVRTLQSGLANRVTSLSWSFDGQWLAASYDDPSASILIWRIDSSHG